MAREARTKPCTKDRELRIFSMLWICKDGPSLTARMNPPALTGPWPWLLATDCACLGSVLGLIEFAEEHALFLPYGTCSGVLMYMPWREIIFLRN